MAEKFDPLSGLQMEGGSSSAEPVLDVATEQPTDLEQRIDIERTVQASMTSGERLDRGMGLYFKNISKSGAAPVRYNDEGGKELFNFAVRKPEFLEKYTNTELDRNIDAALDKKELRIDGEYHPNIYGPEMNNSKVARRIRAMANEGQHRAEHQIQVDQAIKMGGYGRMTADPLVQVEKVMKLPYISTGESGMAVVDGLDFAASAVTTNAEVDQYVAGGADKMQGLNAARERLYNALEPHTRDSEERIRLREVMDSLPAGVFLKGSENNPDAARDWARNYAGPLNKPWQADFNDMSWLSGLNHRKKLAEVERIFNRPVYRDGVMMAPAQVEGNRFKDQPPIIKSAVYAMLYQSYNAPNYLTAAKNGDLEAMKTELGAYAPAGSAPYNRGLAVRQWVEENEGDLEMVLPENIQIGSEILGGMGGV